MTHVLAAKVCGIEAGRPRHGMHGPSGSDCPHAGEGSIEAVQCGGVKTGSHTNLVSELELLQALATDPHPRVRVAALRALGDRRDAALLSFFRERFAKDDSYLAQAESLRAIGRIGDASSLPFLEKAATISSPRNVIRTAAEWARKEIAR